MGTTGSRPLVVPSGLPSGGAGGTGLGIQGRLGLVLGWAVATMIYAVLLVGQRHIGLRLAPPMQYLEFGLTYTLLLSAIIAVQLSRRLDAQSRDAAVLLALTWEAELRALKAQIRPHSAFSLDLHNLEPRGLEVRLCMPRQALGGAESSRAAAMAAGA